MSIYSAFIIGQGATPAGGLFSGNFVITMGFMIAIFQAADLSRSPTAGPV